jgi:hypothetical protein
MRFEVCWSFSCVAFIWCKYVVLFCFVVVTVANNVNAVKNILQANKYLLNAKLLGFEGADIREIIPNVRLTRNIHRTLNLKIHVFVSRRQSDAISTPELRKTVISIHCMLQQRLVIKLWCY